jgi:hypothetical protein
LFGNKMTLTPVQGIDLRSLPSEADFDPFGGDLDAQGARRNFGGLTLGEAYAKFCEAPERLQEDFMFMGWRAFHFYFPVIDEYLRTATSTGEWDDCQAKILAEGIALQFDWRGATISLELRARISQLCAFVRAHLDRYAQLPEDQKEIDRAWVELEGKLR